MNILVVPSWYKTKSNPTLGSFFFEQAQVLKDMGNTVIIADATLQSKRDYVSGRCYRLTREEDEGIIIYSYVIPSLGRFNSDSGGAGAVYKNLRKIYRRMIKDGLTIDLVHAHSYLPAGIAAIRFAKEEKIPVVITEHSSDLLSTNVEGMRAALLSDAVEAADKFICVSNKLREKILDITKCDKNKVTVIPNVVDSMFEYKPLREKHGFTFVSIGNLIQCKRFDLTIDAFSKAFSRDEAVKLLIIGDGVLRTSLEDRVKLLEEEKRISFMGRIERKEVVKYLQESDCLVLPSDYETFGVVYIEALAVGNPVIGSKNGGAEDIINSENGIIVDKNNVGQLSEAMRNVYSNIEKYDRLQIANTTKKKYGRSAIGKELEKIYHNLIDNEMEN